MTKKSAVLTEPRQRILRSARPVNDDGSVAVVRPLMNGGLEASTERRNIAWLVAAGLLEPNAHGDFYITDAGRAFVAAERES